MKSSPSKLLSCTVPFVHVLVALLLFCLHVDRIYADEAATAPKPTTFTGTVEWFNKAKGYGFIVSDDGTGEFFVHHSKIEGEGLRTLEEGQHVRFVPTVSPRGKEASEVQVIPYEKLENGPK